MFHCIRCGKVLTVFVTSFQKKEWNLKFARKMICSKRIKLTYIEWQKGILTYCDGLVCECQPCLPQGLDHLDGWRIQYDWKCLALYHYQSQGCHILHSLTCEVLIFDLPEILFLNDVLDHTRNINPFWLLICMRVINIY